MPVARKSPHSHGRSEVRTRKDLAPAIKRELRLLGARLRELREARGLSQEDAAELMGLHPKYMPRLEGGTANPTVATMVAASVAYKVPLRELFLEPDERGTDK
ncbi:helix-turn-helix domain-containing protein [Pyxidicoccus trucidator]|uniref:helix-turn-helix domain-containing protein n=1 Tax=Pyxidicoccus trucidator TaxID=2709662 RepID=UPI001F0817C2|nr:helix-turn-helix transcriptional regulator [Pyxidicoccus trucidator]